MNKGLREVPRSTVPTKQYRDGWDRIFRSKQKEQQKDRRNG